MKGELEQIKKEIKPWQLLLFIIALTLGGWILGVILANIAWHIDTRNAAIPADYAVVSEQIFYEKEQCIK